MNIRYNIILRICAVGLFTSLILSVIIFFRGLELPYEMLNHEMSQRAEVLRRELARVGPDRLAESHLEDLATLYWVRIVDRNLQPVFISALAREVKIDIPDSSRDGSMIMTSLPLRHFIPEDEDDEPAGLYYKVYQVITGEDAYTIHIAKPVEDLVEESLELTLPIGLGLLISTGVLLLVSWFVADRVLRPIREINRMAQAINEQTLEKRIPRSMNRDELDELAASLNRMFDRLQYSFLRQKEFIADAAHELKTPVTILRLSVEEGLQEQSLSEQMKTRLAHLDLVLERMYLLIRNLLELSHLELSDVVMPLACDLAELADSVVADFALLMEERSISYTLERGEGPFALHLDKEKIRRLLINLVDNAIKYNEPGGRIRLSMHQDEYQVQLELANTGSGVRPEDQPRVFEQFFRGEKSRAIAHGGSGLGLAIAARIVAMHGGTIGLVSEPGAWTRVTLTLPRNSGFKEGEASAQAAS